MQCFFFHWLINLFSIWWWYQFVLQFSWHCFCWLSSFSEGPVSTWRKCVLDTQLLPPAPPVSASTSGPRHPWLPRYAPRSPTRAGHNNTPVTPLLLPQQQISANNLTIPLGARTESEMRSLPFYEFSKIHKQTLTFLSYKLGHVPKQ